jgi:glycine/D-amino acid oxidase-like deaminating enzyme
MKLASYWLDTVRPFRGGAEGPLQGNVDVAVIGGGFSGLSAALALANKGASVAVIEAEVVGGQASGRNGGHCNNGLAHDFHGIAGRLGVPLAASLYRAYDAAVDTVERLVKEERIDCDFKRTGKIKVAAKAAHFDGLARSHTLLSKGVDTDTRLLTKSDLLSEIGSDAFHGGLLYARSGSMHMGRFACGLAEAAVRAGARIYEYAPVTKLHRVAGAKHEVESERGAVVANQVLVATGPSVAGPFGYFRRRIVPIGSFIIATEPLRREMVEALLPKRRTVTTSKNIGFYFRLTPDDRLLFGGRARFATSNMRSDQRSGKILERAMLGIFPQLRGTRVDYCWGGLVDMTADRLPRAGEHDGLFYSMGYSGHGAQMSVHMGQVMAEVMNGRSDLNPWRDLDWPAIPGHFGPPWFLPFVGAYYRIKDVLQ